MNHLNDGAIRRLLDEPFAVSPEDRAHVETCSRCSATLQAVKADHKFTSQILGSPASAVDLVAARNRFKARGRVRRRGHLPFFSLPRSAMLSGLASVVVAGAVALSVASGADAGFLGVFQPSQFNGVPVTRADLASLPQLRHFGTLRLPANLNSSRYGSLSAAESAAGVHIEAPSSLPSGIPASSYFQVIPGASSSFTLSAAKTAAYAQQVGKAIPSMPTSLDGSVVTVATHTGVLTEYGPKREDIPDLVIAQMRTPTLTIAGATLSQIESYLLTVPGMPKQLVKQLGSLSSPTSTLPIPVPVNWAYAQHVTIQGRPGLLVGDDTGVASVVIWEKAGVVYGVGGALTSSQVLQVANSLS